MKIGTAGVPPSKFVISPLSGNIGIDAGHDTLMLPYPSIKLPKPHVTRYLSFWHQYSTAKRAVLINISLISLACVAWRFCRAGRTSGEAAKAASCPNLLAVLCPRPPLLVSAPNQNRYTTQADRAEQRLRMCRDGRGLGCNLVSFSKGFSKHPHILAIIKVDSEYSRLPFKLKVDYFILYLILVSTFVIFLLLSSMNNRRRTKEASWL